MSICEHGERMTKVCITELCQNKEAAGCDQCIKKYHFHLSNQRFLNETDVESLIKDLTMSPKLRPQNKHLQQIIFNQLKGFKSMISDWVQEISNAIADKLFYPMLSKAGLLATFKKLKTKEYKKLLNKQIRSLIDFKKKKSVQNMQTQQQSLYFQATQFCLQVSQTIESTVQGFKDQLQLSSELRGSEYEGKEVAKYSSKIQQMIHNAKLERNRTATQELSKVTLVAEKNLLQVPTESTKRQKSQDTRRRRASIDNRFNMAEDHSNDTAVKLKKIFTIMNQKSETQNNKSQNSVSDVSTKSVANEQLNNILPPLPKSRNKYQEQVKSDSPKIVKIPMKNLSKDQNGDEVKSPILIKKYNLQASLFPIELKRVPEQKEQLSQIKQSLNEETPIKKEPDLPERSDRSPKRVLSLPKQQVEEIDKQIKITINPPIQELQDKPRVKQSKSFHSQSESKEQDNQSVMLTKEQRNSVILFSEALKCQSKKAIELLQAALFYAPNNLSATEYLSYLYLEAERAIDCLRVCDMTLSLMSNSNESFEASFHLLNHKAVALNMVGRCSQSKEILERLVKYKNEDYLFRNLGDALCNLAMYEKAQPYYQKGIKINSQSDESNYNYAVCLYHLHSFSEAEFYVKRALRLNPTNPTYLQLAKQLQAKLQIF